MNSRNAWLGLAVLASLGAGGAWGQASTADASQVVIREQGKPERRCIVEQADRQPDGKVMYLVRDLATGEQLRVLDGRPHKPETAPVVSQVMANKDIGDAGMIEALASSPVNDKSARLRTTAELAGSSLRQNTVR